MLETLLGTRRGAISAGLVLDIDFAGVPLDTKTIVDKAQNIAFTLQGAPSSVNTNFGVVDVVGAGRLFRFNGINYFFNPNKVMGDISLGSFDIEIAYLKQNTAIQNLFTTGCYNTAPVSGMAILIDQGTYISNSFQFAMISAAGGVERNFSPGMNTQQLTEMLIERRKGVTTVTNKLTGVKSVNNGPQILTGDSWLGIGSDVDGAARFSGYLKYLRVRKITG